LGNTPWREWTYTVPAEGIYRIEARVANKVNSGFDSVLGLDGVTLSAPPNRPPLASAGPDYSVVEAAPCCSSAPAPTRTATPHLRVGPRRRRHV
jgi:hypothetical protein